MMDNTIIEGKINQIIEHKDKAKFILPSEIVKSKKNVIVIETKEQKSIIDTFKRYFWRTDEFVEVLLSDRIDFEIGEIVSLKVKPYWVKTKFYEIDE
ncbi:hypothetical protein KAU33_15900 [Candidatus Dependentiae bacterium]|nr:hypothetical protein [Candidatus Dependentiae bacterium]